MVSCERGDDEAIRSPMRLLAWFFIFSKKIS